MSLSKVNIRRILSEGLATQNLGVRGFQRSYGLLRVSKGLKGFNLNFNADSEDSGGSKLVSWGLNYKINIFKKKINGILRDSGQRCTKILGSCQPLDIYSSIYFSLLRNLCTRVQNLL